MRPTYAVIDLDRIRHNIEELKRKSGDGCELMAVVKADAYGHGSVHIAKEAVSCGCTYLAVATLEEGIELRANGITQPILVLGYIPCEDYFHAARYDLTVTVYLREHARYISERNIAVRAHIKIDTGMGRLGYMYNDLEGILEAFRLLDVEGVFTHFAKADEKDKTFTFLQLERFKKVLVEIEKAGFMPRYRHARNSAAIIDIEGNGLNLARAGIAMYGLYPSDEVDRTNVNLKQAMSLYSEVSNVKEVNGGMGISYNHRFVAEKKTNVATLPIGYADGYMRILTGRTFVFAKGEKRDVIGTICMDQMMFDATGLDIKVGDKVEILGDNITVDEIAKLAGTINYEVLTSISRRVPRVYLKNGKTVYKVCRILPTGLQDE